MSDLEPLWDVPGVAEHFRMSTTTVRRKVASGEWPARKVGRTYKFTRDDVHRIIELSSTTPTPPQDAA